MQTSAIDVKTMISELMKRHSLPCINKKVAAGLMGDEGACGEICENSIKLYFEFFGLRFSKKGI